MNRHFLEIADFTPAQLNFLLDRVVYDKVRFGEGRLPPYLSGQTLAMIFEKPSLRTRVSFEVAMTQLGGHSIYLAPADIGLGQREAVRDVARVLGRMCEGIMARTFSHEALVELAEHAGVPVVNALSDYSHPCQAMADLLTVHEHLVEPDEIPWNDRRQPEQSLRGRTLTFVGDGNNVARSLAMASAKLGLHFVLACPAGYELGADFVETVRQEARTCGAGGSFRTCHDPREAVAEADVIYTDTWTSMGQEEHKQQRQADFAGFAVDADLLAAAPDSTIVLHCLPAYKGVEISEEVFEAHAGTIFAQAENRLHFQRSLLAVLMGECGVPERI
jgi:ornithine carbamoyltransferase